MKGNAGLEIAVRNPAGILEIERLLYDGEEMPGILSPERREALRRISGNPAAARVPLCADILLALLDWMEAKAWKRLLVSDCHFRNTVRELLERLSALVKMDRSGGNSGIEGSLVVRYLIALASTCVDVKDRTQVMAATYQRDAFRLPAYWPGPNERWRENVTEADWMRFRTAWEHFWSDNKRVRSGRCLRKRQRKKSLREHLLEQGLRWPTREQKRAAAFPLRETELANDAPPLARHLQPAQAGLSAFAAQIVVDSRPFAVGLKLLERTLRLSPDKQTPLRSACLALIETALFCGVAVHDGLNLALVPTKTLGPATFNQSRGCLTSHLAFGYYPVICGRIPPQDVDIPILPHTRDLFEHLVNGGYQTLAEPFGPKPLDVLLDTIEDLVSSSGIRVFLRRLDVGWLYAAHRLARLNPGLIALLRGDVFGPYRSETSYLSVSEQYLWSSAYKVHDAILHFLGIHIPEKRELGRSDVFIGKKAASLETLASFAGAILSRAEEPGRIAACSSWIEQFHGRRPTSDYPHAGAYAIQCDGEPAFLLADKNMGGGRRLRLVPASQGGFDAAMAAVRRT